MPLVLEDVKLLKQRAVMTYHFVVPDGAFMAVIGGRKSMRSALLHLVAGFESPTSGHVYLRDLALHTLMPSERPLTIIFQESNLFNHLNLFENVSLGLKGTLHLNAIERRKVGDFLTYVGLENLFFKKPNDVSPYIQQKAALARSLLGGKPLLLLDEPFGSLQKDERDAYARLLNEVHHTFQLTTLMVVSDPQEAQVLSSHLAVIGGEKIVSSGPTDTIFYQPHLQSLILAAAVESSKMRMAC